MPKMGSNSAGDFEKGVPTDIPGTDSDGSIEATGLGLRGGLITTSDMTTSTDRCDPVEELDVLPTSARGKYSRKDLSTQDVFWTCSLEEFRAMSDKQWASFGTAFYVAPAGFDSATKHVVQLE